MKRNLYRVLIYSPAILAILVVAGLIVRAMTTSDDIAVEYRLAARQAVADKDLEKAKFYYSRLVGAGDRGSEQDQMNWVSILDASGDTQAAREMLDRLAPDDSVGFASAHRQKAIMYGAAIAKNGTNKDLVEKLQFHLRHGARDATPENDILWANYHLAVEQVDEAVKRFESAAGRKPELWFDISNLYRRLGREEDAARASTRAEAYAVNAIGSDPMDSAQRVRLLAILASQKKFEQVDAILNEGLRLTGDDPALRAIASNLVLMRMEQIPGDDPSSENSADRQRMAMLSEAAKLNPSNPNVYKVLNAFYARSDSADLRAKFREQLETWIAEGHTVPLAHFSLGNLLWQESDSQGAIFHLEAALKADPSMAIVANNLAWVLCQSDDPDFERSESLIQMAIETAPDNASFGDTMAMVLFKQKKYAEALPYFEKVLPKATGQKKVQLHENLAEVYDALGQPKMAEKHRKESGRKAEAETAENEAKPTEADGDSADADQAEPTEAAASPAE
ncbi:tetratricopeptide repeat protein [Rubripirellula reticaptiva]|uniref:Tetratricopeptide repeat protein n=1 Tax=Rubripirellula reticaptiva TaxID=2528013 RepID=A0A5C6F6R6_9BACT|nr:tetratricopeptide repeat protein [Rubripirellula reticaptiva]TWU55201.1 Tetratricopeptide repeat protein [Rubripirellula reticaptiva]